VPRSTEIQPSCYRFVNILQHGESSTLSLFLSPPNDPLLHGRKGGGGRIPVSSASRVPGSPSSVLVFLVRQVRFSCSWFAIFINIKFCFQRVSQGAGFTTFGFLLRGSQCLNVLKLKVSSSRSSSAFSGRIPFFPPPSFAYTHLTDLFLLCLLLCVACMCSKTGPGVGAQGREGLLT
jgi:hypothetical protein